jgi:hypothetical protein
MPAINIGTLFIGQEDWEGDDGSGVATEDDNDTDTEAGGVRARFLGGHPSPTLGGAFREDEDGNEMMETSRDNKHEEDIMMRSMFETLCEGKPLLSSSMDHPKRQLSAMTAARAGGADPSRTKQSRMGQGRGDALVRTTTTNDYIIPCIK